MRDKNSQKHLAKEKSEPDLSHYLIFPANPS